MSVTLYEAHSYDEAIVESERLIELEPNHLSTYITYATSLVQKGRFQEAEAAFRRSHVGDRSGCRGVVVRPAGQCTAAARQVLKENASSPINPFTAVAHYLLGEQERGLAQLDYLANVAWANKTYFLRSDPYLTPCAATPLQ